MADIRTVKRALKRISRVRTWQLVLLLILLVLAAAALLRLNNIGMVERRDAVIAADAKGKPEDIKAALLSLQHYVAHHMNTDGNTVYLQKQFDRDSAELVKKAVETSRANPINKEVDDICRPQYSGYGQGYVECSRAEHAKRGPGKNPVATLALPDGDNYRYSYAPPLLSFDLAGWVIIAIIIIIGVIIVRTIALWCLLLMLRIKRRKRPTPPQS